LEVVERADAELGISLRTTSRLTPALIAAPERFGGSDKNLAKAWSEDFVSLSRLVM
jgi:hypothetical protein